MKFIKCDKCGLQVDLNSDDSVLFESRNTADLCSTCLGKFEIFQDRMGAVYKEAFASWLEGK